MLLNQRIIEDSAETKALIQRGQIGIEQAWSTPLTPFNFIHPEYSNRDNEKRPSWMCGCLSMIKSANKPHLAFNSDGKGFFPDHDLSAVISGDDRVPTDGSALSVAHIPLFAAWQSNIVEYWDGERDVDNVAPTDEEVRAMAKTIADEVETLERNHAA